MSLLILLIVFFIPYCRAESWDIYVYTGKEKYAGTDSNVYIRLFNSQDESTGEYQLTHSNWIPEKAFPVRNLFEVGARERFVIQTEDIGPLAKIKIRRNNFPAFQADWLLDQVVVERNKDGTKYTFKCNCWLRQARTSITLSAFQDPNISDKNKSNGSSSRAKRAFVSILLLLIAILVSIFCCYNEYHRRLRRRRQRSPSFSLTDQNEQIHQESSFLDTCNPQSPRSPSPLSGPQLWFNTLLQWKSNRHDSSTHHPQQASPSAGATSVASPVTTADAPPAYEDLYPNSTTPINTSLNSNV